jgi:vancomycin resistance protein VanJ
MKFSCILLTGLGTQMIFLGAMFAFIGLGAAGEGAFGAYAAGMMDVANSFLAIWLLLCVLGLLCVAFALEARPARNNLILLALAGILAAAVPIGWEQFRNSPLRPDASGALLRVMQFNAFEGNFRPRLAVDTILASQADVVTLQEPRKLLSQMDRLRKIYPYHTPCSTYCAVLILSKTPASSSSAEELSGPSGRSANGPSYGDVEVARMTLRGADGKHYTVVTAHYNWPIPPQPFSRGQALLNQYLAKLDRDRLILTGDFNLTPWAVAMRRQDRAFAPLVRVTRNMFSWPAYVPRIAAPMPLPFLPIDHVYTGPIWTASKVERLQRAGSDHFPIAVDLHLQPYNASH